MKKKSKKEKELKPAVPKDLSLYPGFPNILGLSKEQADSSIIEFWRKLKAKRDQNDKNRRELLQSRKTVFPPGFWKDPTALMPKDKSQYPDFPNIEGLPKDEADSSIIEFWKKFKEKKDQQKQGRKDTRNGRKMEFIEKFKKIVEKGNLYDKYHEVVLKVSNLPPHNST